jgi:hypothetical protein
MAKELDTAQIVTILKSGNFNDLLGVVEDDHFECKGEPYRIEEDHQKFELAKDISALANAQGGIIVIGVQTEQDPTRATDVINKIRPIAATVVNVSQYENVVRTWVYPPVKDIEIRWFESSQKTGLGLVAIMVGNQGQVWRPFLLTRSIEPSGRVSTTLFGYAERGTGKSLPMSVQQLHTILRDGYRVGTGAFVPITRPEQVPPQKGPTHSLAGRIEAAIEAVELIDRPVFILAAAPEQMIELESLFSTRDADVVRLLEDPPHLRPSGFGPDAGINSRIVEGKCRRAVVPQYKLLEVWRDGTVIMVAAGDAEFLAWGNRSGEKLRINQLVLIECNYLFAVLVRELLHKATPVPTSMLFRLGIRRMTVKDRCLLFPGPLTRFPHGAKPAPGPDVSFDTIGKAEEDPGYLSFKLVANLYHWFSFEDDQIPYTSLNENGKPFIDRAKIIELNQRPL